MRQVAIIVPWLEGGGAQSSLLGILKNLHRVDTTLIVLFAGSRNHADVLQAVQHVEEFGYSRSLTGTVRAALRLRKLLPRFDRVYSLMRASHIALGLVPSASLLQNKFAASVHQLPMADRASFRGRVEDLALRRGLRNATVVSTPSRLAASQLVTFRLAASSSVHYEPNIFVSSSSRRSSPRAGELSRLRLVFAGRLTVQNGLLAFLEQIANLPIDLRIVGDGPELDALKRSIRDWHGPASVELVGRSEDVQGHLDWSDCAIMPSVAELSPVFVWEAWDRGRPVIASDIPAFRELESEGPIIRFGSHRSLEEVVRMLMQSEASREVLHERALAAGASSAEENKIVTFLNS